MGRRISSRADARAKKKRFLILLGLALMIMGGCSTISTPPYSVSADTRAALKKLGVSSVGVGSFTEPADFNNSCRAVGPLALPDGMSHTEYIRKALEDELKAAGVFSADKPRVVLSGTVQKLEFSSTRGLTGGTWDLALKLSSTNGGQISASEHFEFESGLRARTACRQTAEAYMPAVQSLIRKMVQSPGFKRLVQ